MEAEKQQETYLPVMIVMGTLTIFTWSNSTLSASSAAVLPSAVTNMGGSSSSSPSCILAAVAEVVEVVVE